MEKVEKNIGAAYYEGKELVGVELGYSGEGYCYTDLDARGDEVCYLPEIANDYADDDDIIRFSKGPLKYTFNDVREAIRREALEDERITHLTDEQLDSAAIDVLKSLAWESVETYLRGGSIDFYGWFFEDAAPTLQNIIQKK